MNQKPLILVIDGQGGGLGREIIEQIRVQLPSDLFSYSLLACGTNSLATQTMLRAGADMAATGEAAIIYQSPRADFILGPAGILAAHSLMGELSPAMAAAIGSCEATKYIVPVNMCRIKVTDYGEPLPKRIENCVRLLATDYKEIARANHA